MGGGFVSVVSASVHFKRIFSQGIVYTLEQLFYNIIDPFCFLDHHLYEDKEKKKMAAYFATIFKLNNMTRYSLF